MLGQNNVATRATRIDSPIISKSVENFLKFPRAICIDGDDDVIRERVNKRRTTKSSESQ